MADHVGRTVADGPRIGLIGAGEISEWHVRALRAAGCTVSAIAARTGSSRAGELARRLRIPVVFDSWQDLLDRPREWDGLVIASHTDATADILTYALRTKVPILVEKPVAWTSKRIADLRVLAHPLVLVGFNRRFYRTVQFVRDYVRTNEPLLAHLSLPEALGADGDGTNPRRHWRPFFSNSCHGLDILRFVFGPLRVESVHRLVRSDGRLYGLGAMLSSARGDVIQLSGNWGTAANFGLCLDRPGRRVELRPFEIATVYEGMDVLEPSDEAPIRRYVPRVKERIDLESVDCVEKPGFVQQALAFRALFESGPSKPTIAAGLEDAEAAVKLCEDLVGGTYEEA
jgi:predicted dehydrogenase